MKELALSVVLMLQTGCWCWDLWKQPLIAKDVAKENLLEILEAAILKGLFYHQG